MLVSLLMGSLFLLMYGSVRLPFGVALDGSPIKLVSLTLWECLLLRRRNLYCLGVILLLSAIGHWFSTPIELGLMLLGLCINLLPTRYRFTSAGVACNNTLFRHWNEFESIQLKGSQLIFTPHAGFAPLTLVLHPSRQQEVLVVLERFLEVNEQGGSAQSHPLLLWLRNRLSRHTLYAMLLSFVLMLLVSVLFSACGEVGQDPSGLNTASQQNLTHIAVSGTNPTITSNSLNQAKTQEPFAYNLAILVDENRLSVNFVWTLVTGYMVMFMQVGSAVRRMRLTRLR
jgi:ammonium transporter, Amt family